MEEQSLLPTLEWPALVTGPVFLEFEISGKPGHKGRHRSRLVIPGHAWSDLYGCKVIAKVNIHKLFIQPYPDPETAAYEKMIAEYAGLLMNRKHVPPTEAPLSVIVHAFKPIPASWSKTDRARALAGNIRPTSRPDGDNYLKIVDALNGIVFKDDSQIVDGRVLKLYSDRPGLRIEVREMIEPT